MSNHNFEKIRVCLQENLPGEFDEFSVVDAMTIVDEMTHKLATQFICYQDGRSEEDDRNGSFRVNFLYGDENLVLEVCVDSEGKSIMPRKSKIQKAIRKILKESGLWAETIAVM